MDRKKLLELGTLKADKFLEKLKMRLSDKGLDEERIEYICSRHRQSYKRGYRKGLWCMRAEVIRTLQEYAKENGKEAKKHVVSIEKLLEYT